MGSGCSTRLDAACFGVRGSATLAVRAHDLDAEAGIDGLDLVAQETGHALHVAHRQAGADAHGLGPTVDAMAYEIEPARAEALFLQGVAELASQYADIARDGLSRADRLGESAADLDQLLGADRLKRTGKEMKFIVEGVTNSAPADTTLIRLLVRGQKIAKRMFEFELSAARGHSARGKDHGFLCDAPCAAGFSRS